MKSRARCRNCGLVTYAARMKSVSDPPNTKRFGLNGFVLPSTGVVCKDVEKCRARYDREALRLKRHAEHVTYQRALKGGAR